MVEVKSMNKQSTKERAKSLTNLSLVTGASHGIGRAIAIGLGRAGYKVMLTARSQDELEETAKRVEANEGSAFVVSGDLSSARGRAELVGYVKKHGGKLKTLIHCASASTNPETDATLENTETETIDQIVGTTISGTMHLLKEMKPFLSAASPANVVLIASDWAMRGSHGPPVFSAAKAAIGHLAHTIRREFAHAGISITTLYPGDVASFDKDWTEPVWQIDDPIEKVRAELGESRILLSDIVEAVLFAITRKMSRVEEIHMSPLDPEYDY